MPHPDYGIDAPGLLKFFFATGTISSTLLLVILVGLPDGLLKLIAGLLLVVISVYCLSLGCFMLFYSKVQKLNDQEALINLIPWSGYELVLDVGCGRGLMLIGAAKRLTTGKATGIDLWQQQDQANNSPEATLTNAKLEQVGDRVEVKTADMRQLPFPDQHFDAILSHWAVHNLEAPGDRQQALTEILRVLKPGGHVVLGDIAHQAEYADYFRQHDNLDVQLHNHPLPDIILSPITFGSFTPSAISVSKQN